MWKKTVNRILSFVIFLIIFIMGTNWVIDPYMKFRKATYINPIYNTDTERYLNAGIAKYNEYNAVLIGTSMTENFLIKDINSFLNINSIKLSYSGGTAKEFSHLIEWVFKQNKCKSILFGFDVLSFQNFDSYNGYQRGVVFPHYMYKNDILSDLEYLFAWKTSIASVETMKHTFDKNVDSDLEYNYAYTWYQGQQADRNKVIEDWNSRNDVKHQEIFSKKNYEYSILVKNYKMYLRPSIISNPQINFVIFFPPYSYLAWELSKERGSYSNIQKFKSYVLNDLKNQKNVEIYDFQNEEEIIKHLEYYKDIEHYSEKINLWMIQQIANKKYKVTF